VNRFRIRYSVTYEFEVVEPTVADAAIAAREFFSKTPRHKTLICISPVSEAPPDRSHAEWAMMLFRKKNGT
jgi:hypothetical protein